MENSPPKEEGKEEDPTTPQPTPQDGDDSADLDLESLFEDESDPEAEKEKFLAQVNKVEKRDYKTIEDWAKTNAARKKIADKFYTEQGRKKDEEGKQATPPATGDKYASRLLKLENPKAQYVMDEIKEVAKANGIDEFEVWEKYAWIRKEAEIRAEEAEKKAKNEKKITKPSNKIQGTGGEGELSEADRALLERRGLTDKFVKEHNP